VSATLPFSLSGDAAAASAALADWLAEALATTLASAPSATIAVPGGTTPGPFLQAFARKNLPWPRITFLPSDERWVPPDHARSNDSMIRQHLTPALTAGAHWLSFAPPALDSSMETHRQSVIAQLASRLPLTAVISGMGEDGHICSLFPGDPQINHNGPEPVLIAHPQGLEPRLSLSPSALRAARVKALLFGGSAKIKAIVAALQPGPEMAIPVRILLRSGSDLRVFAWQ
jgi:6-phosphogluconolactonase